jgi:hypothetical protein
VRDTVCEELDWIAATRVLRAPSPCASVDPRAEMMPILAQVLDGAATGAAIAASGRKNRRMGNCILRTVCGREVKGVVDYGTMDY